MQQVIGTGVGTFVASYPAILPPSTSEFLLGKNPVEHYYLGHPPSNAGVGLLGE